MNYSIIYIFTIRTYVRIIIVTMSNVPEPNRPTEVICQHKFNGMIIPIKIRFTDDDGEYHDYMIKGYRDRTTYSKNQSGHLHAVNDIWTFECKIQVFGDMRIISLLYNARINSWILSQIH